MPRTKYKSAIVRKVTAEENLNSGKKSTTTTVWDDAVLGCHGRRWSKKRWRGRRKEGRWEGVPVECRLKLHGE